MATTDKIPVCDILLTNEEFDYYNTTPDTPIPDQVTDLINSDCWAITITKNSVQTVKMNFYTLFEDPSNKISSTSLLEELTSSTDHLDIYMFQDHSWKIRVTKTETGYEYNYYKSKEGLYPVL